MSSEQTPSPISDPLDPSVLRVRLGRYALFGEIAHGGMATVHFGRLQGVVGFSRTVAIKRMHPHLARDEAFVAMFIDEVRLASRIRHGNVIETLDVVSDANELLLVMEYLPGESLWRLLREIRQAGDAIPVDVARAVVSGVLHGLHAAHVATGERRERLGIVHRDVSPQNIMVGTDGLARVLDFGAAKAEGRIQHTRDGQLKGKLAYMSREQIRGDVLDARSDVYATSVVLWEMLAGRKLFQGDSQEAILHQVVFGDVPKLSEIGETPALLSELVARGLARDPLQRFASAREMALALEATGSLATPHVVSEWLERYAHATLAKRAEVVAQIESVDLGAHDSEREHGRAVGPRGAAFVTHEPEAPGHDAPTRVLMGSGSDDDPLSGDATAATPSAAALSADEASLAESHSGAVVPVFRNADRVSPSASTPRWPFAIAAVCLAAIALYLMASSAGANKPAPAAPPVEPVRAAVPAAIASALPVNAPAAIVPSAPGAVIGSPAVPPTSTAVSRATPKAPPKTAPSSAKATKAGPEAPQPAKPATKDCSLPYTIDRDGIRHPKPQCL